mgnify:CR=1 FL=1
MKTLRDILETVLIALVIAILVRSFVVERFVVDGPSMEPTMWTDESLMVFKIAYRFGQPKRGDIVVFQYPYSGGRGYRRDEARQGIRERAATRRALCPKPRLLQHERNNRA